MAKKAKVIEKESVRAESTNVDNINGMNVSNINDINVSAAQLDESELAVVRRISAKIGLGVENYLFAIKDALGATKRSVDKSGAESIDIDHVTRLKAAEMGMNFEGYSSAKIANNVVDNRKYTQVVYKYEGF